MYDDFLGSDNLHRCYRCDDVDTVDEICTFCKQELVAHHDHEMSWRKAWELEQDEEMRREIKKDEQWIYRRKESPGEIFSD